MDLEKLKQQFIEDIAKVQDEHSLADIETKFLGRKGELTEILKSLAGLTLEKKKVMGPKANNLRDWMSEKIADCKFQIADLKWQKIAKSEKQDINTPTLHYPLSTIHYPNGHLHPLSNFIFKIERVFEEMGFEVVDSYDIETDYYNFTALNIPPDHPTRDTQDTFYIKKINQANNKSKSDEFLLKTQTSSMQVRYMKNHEPPIKIIVPGKCFRRDDDATHSPQFHQFEGLVVDKDLTMGHLKETLSLVMRKLLGEETKIRFRSSFFPFVEPGLEVDVTCPFCKGQGCNVCKKTGWIEMLGAGMVHPNVLREGGIDPEIYSGFAFGTGIERLAMMKHKIPNIKLLYENDLRFLNQF
ncbi:phenylalanine--tRNA ligase subunit alpha [Candidatus Microgenomates bacterium]|nr:phenylalanine--tRNA ligase subunit alpha [Candidatus Microgenomates bacterium]